ncbi:Serine/threonine-protein kinase pim-3 [Phytophthora boehmeriae]|uniref:Serine/threonine-protein kinase pim-3 n=1 Tax=Phytophthora boehmeriae TaxID=109152 RepID=A0A8T1VJA1_9STRA|nr:Serine/threonine-protein kinase pim-3 [Phytophthora boehmeriae]
MTSNLLDMVVPGLGSSLELLASLYAKYSEFKEGKKLCKSLHKRLEGFTEELKKIPSHVLQTENLLRDLQDLIEAYAKTVTTYAELNFVKRLLKLDEFSDDIKMHNERLDDIINMLIVNHTEKLAEQFAELKNWRGQYEKDAESIIQYLKDIRNVQMDIWIALKEMPSKREIEDLVLLAKRDISIDPAQSMDPALNEIVRIAEEDFQVKTTKTPPMWLVAPDEVVLSKSPIDTEGLTHTFVGRWQGIQVAVKKFEILDESPVFNKHFVVWRSLLHRHVAQLYGAGSDNGAPFFIYEYASKTSLDRYWNTETLAQSDLWRMLYQAALGLSYLHKKHIVHGNLSCAKLLVTAHGDVKLFGFGASYIRENDKSNSIKPMTREEFAAPECIGIRADGKESGVRHSPSFKSDVYSFGLTIMEAFTKEEPFSRMSTREIKNVKSDPLPRPDGLNDAAWNLVKQMCVCDPTKRVSLRYVTQELEHLATQVHDNQTDL